MHRHKVIGALPWEWSALPWTRRYNLQLWMEVQPWDVLGKCCFRWNRDFGQIEVKNSKVGASNSTKYCKHCNGMKRTIESYLATLSTWKGFWPPTLCLGILILNKFNTRKCIIEFSCFEQMSTHIYSAVQQILLNCFYIFFFISADDQFDL